MAENAENSNANQARVVSEFHNNADTDSSVDAIHHTLGPSPTQAAPGDHNHQGGNSTPLFTEVTISGSRTDGTALKALLGALVALGLNDETTT